MKKYTLEIADDYKKHPLPGRDEWLKALRSGEYKQTTNSLLDKKILFQEEVCSYCCLGVLSKIQGRLTDSGFDSEERSDGDSLLSESNPLYKELDSSGEFPSGIRFFDEDGAEHISLSSINDGGYIVTGKQIGRAHV